MLRHVAAVVLGLLSAGLVLTGGGRALAGTDCSQPDPATGTCLVTVTTPGTPSQPSPADHPNPGSGSGSGGGGSACFWDGTSQGIKNPPPGPVPCKTADGYWSNSYHCYISALTPQPPPGDASWQGHDPGDGAVYNCLQTQTGIAVTVWSANPPDAASAGPSPGEVAQMAVKRMDLSAIRIGIAPKPGRDSVGLVGMPVWMWAASPDAHTVGPARASASAGGVTVTATAQLEHVTWDMGDGTTVICKGAGTPFARLRGSRRRRHPDARHHRPRASAPRRTGHPRRPGRHR